MIWHTASPLLIEKALPEELCDDLLCYIKDSASRPRTFQGELNETLRKSDYVEMDRDLERRVFTSTRHILVSHFGTDVSPIRQPSVAYLYGPGAGFVAHHDEVSEIEKERAATNGQPVVGGDITMVFWLSHPPEYEGGALFFDTPPMEFRPPRGAAVAFPATRDYIHGVRPITTGERITLVMRVSAGAGGSGRSR